MAAGRLDAAQARRILDLCWRFDQLGDIGELMAAFPAAQPGLPHFAAFGT
jgi:hypothetical protein